MFRQLDSVFRPEEVDKGNHKVVPENWEQVEVFGGPESDVSSPLANFAN